MDNDLLGHPTALIAREFQKRYPRVGSIRGSPFRKLGTPKTERLESKLCATPSLTRDSPSPTFRPSRHASTCQAPANEDIGRFRMMDDPPDLRLLGDVVRKTLDVRGLLLRLESDLMRDHYKSDKFGLSAPSESSSYRSNIGVKGRVISNVIAH